MPLKPSTKDENELFKPIYDLLTTMQDQMESQDNQPSTSLANHGVQK